MYQLASVEIKRSVASISLYKREQYASSEAQMCSDKDPEFLRHIPHEHCVQLPNQDVDLRANFVAYASARETRSIFVHIAHFSTTILDLSTNAPFHSSKEVIAWALKDDLVIPSFVNIEVRNPLRKKLGFWRILNGHIKKICPLPSLKLFEHGSQCLYLKTKGSDGLGYAVAFYATFSEFQL